LFNNKWLHFGEWSWVAELIKELKAKQPDNKPAKK
jgi:hypothetical protein